VSVERKAGIASRCCRCSEQATCPQLPPEVQQSAGDADIMQEIFSFGTALGWGDVYHAILVLLYNSFHPLTIMVALPLPGRCTTRLDDCSKALGLYALIGIVLLLGTDVSILVDYTINLEEGKSQRQALIDAGMSRLRPL